MSYEASDILLLNGEPVRVKATSSSSWSYSINPKTGVAVEEYHRNGELISRTERQLERRPAGWVDCDVYWGSHGCSLERGHDGDHWCYCCDCENHPDHDSGCVAGPPYYGPDTNFFGDDVDA